MRINGQMEMDEDEEEEEDEWGNVMKGNGIVELFGGKNTGKTAMLMFFCQKFAERSKKKIYFINCASGITYKRW